MEIARANEVQQSINAIFNGREEVFENGNLQAKSGIHVEAARFPDNFQGHRDYLLGLAHRYEQIRDIAANEVARLKGEAGGNMEGGRSKKTRRRNKKSTGARR